MYDTQNLPNVIEIYWLGQDFRGVQPGALDQWYHQRRAGGLQSPCRGPLAPVVDIFYFCRGAKKKKNTQKINVDPTQLVVTVFSFNI